MSTSPPDQLYRLLPAVHQIRDSQRGEPLRALLRVIGEQVQLVHQDIDHLYENWFIETCDDWVVAYIADLVGFRQVGDPGEPADMLPGSNPAVNRFQFPRREVANTVRMRRRKGTLSILEELARNVADWPARAVEFANQVFTTPNVNYPHCGYGKTVNLRDRQALANHDGPFNTIYHTVDLRAIQSRPGIGWYHPFKVGLFVWRRPTFSVTRAQPRCIEGRVENQSVRYYSFNPLGSDVQLYVQPEKETDSQHIAEAINLPIPLTRSLLNDKGHASPTFYGQGQSVVIRDKDTPIPNCRIIPADLSNFEKCRTLQKSLTGIDCDKICLDPETGRFLFARGRQPRKLRVTYRYSFPFEMGGGEYGRRVPDRADYPVSRIVPDESAETPFDLTAELEQRLKEVHQFAAAYIDGTCPPSVRGSSVPSKETDDQNKETTERLVIRHDIGFELTTSDTWQLGNLHELRICTGITLELRASNNSRPVVEIHGTRTDCEPTLQIVMEPGSRLILDGLLVFGDPLRIVSAEGESACGQRLPTASDCEECPSIPDTHGERKSIPPPVVEIRHCTLVPGGRPSDACDHCAKTNKSLQLQVETGRVLIDHSILGSINVDRSGCATPCPQADHDAQRDLPCPVQEVELSICDSIVDGCQCPPAIGSECCETAHANLTVHRSTILGDVHTTRIREAEDSIFDGAVNVTRRHDGFMRFCFVPRNTGEVSGDSKCPRQDFLPRTPRRFKCQPDSARVMSSGTCEPPGGVTDPQNSIRPRFVSTTYGHSGYCQLALDCPPEIGRGAESESEMGVFHHLYSAQRSARLRQQLADFTPANMLSTVIFADDLEQP